MKRALLGLAMTAALVLGLAAPAFAATGVEFGGHHAEHAVNEGGFTGGHNPGVMHQGFAGWDMAE